VTYEEAVRRRDMVCERPTIAPFSVDYYDLEDGVCLELSTAFSVDEWVEQYLEDGLVRLDYDEVRARNSAQLERIIQLLGERSESESEGGGFTRDISPTEGIGYDNS